MKKGLPTWEALARFGESDLETQAQARKTAIDLAIF